ncbi:MAG: hypothetical protein QG638_1760 [Pseudomonadota bacterium]|jgi:hypothetical protein|nr:hypothetical protein [Pseudomonadota bacterium]MDQ5902960.1 hypothetical protein [Pseudomonadota bacterium]MDQ5906548.1 hypothetical protein [Pseudomonadota bacterium]
MQTTKEESRLTLHDAARLLAAASVHEAEVELAHAIEHGTLHANVKRWATEQWEGQQLPGNINRLETWIERRDFDAWVAGR